MVANKGLEKVYFNQVLQNQILNVPSEGHEGNPSSQFFWES